MAVALFMHITCSNSYFTEICSCLRKLKGIEGLSKRQIARITGITVNIVAKA
ncbi:MAG: hypothetical protein PWP71_1708 [Clostridia bacterium]|nr:hypothetical protein [Clostridia bacterium]